MVIPIQNISTLSLCGPIFGQIMDLRRSCSAAVCRFSNWAVLKTSLYNFSKGLVVTIFLIGDENPLCFMLDVKKPPLDPFRSFSQWETWKPINSIDGRDLPMNDRDFIWSDQSMVVMFNHTISYFQAFFNEFFDHCTSQSCSCSGIQLTSLLGSDLQRHACG